MVFAEEELTLPERRDGCQTGVVIAVFRVFSQFLFGLPGFETEKLCSDPLWPNCPVSFRGVGRSLAQAFVFEDRCPSSPTSVFFIDPACPCRNLAR